MAEYTVMPEKGLGRSRSYEGTNRQRIPEEMKISIGSLIGEQYEVRGILGGEGKSGMGIVYVCYDRYARQTYALKTFQDRYLYSEKARERFRKEALAWVLLDAHPNIVQAVGVEALDNRLFIVLEYVEPDEAGRNTLTQHLGSISTIQAVEWAIQFCDGMAYAASQGVTPHRDIKPDNIMISRDGTLKITDFGLAGLWEGFLCSMDIDFSRVPSMAGTSPWMAPEQFDGSSDLRSDIYSFGVIMYQMANRGGLPFTSESVDGYRRAHSEARVPRLKSRLFPIISRCLKKSPEDRYGDFHSLRSDLARLYRSLTGVWPPAPPCRIEPGVWEYNNRGLALYNVGQVDKAILVYRKALMVDPVFARQHRARMAIVHNNLGVAYDANGQADMAIYEYREALRLNPCLADAHNNLGTALRAKGLLGEAISEYREALRLKPDSAMAHHNLGLSYACEGELDLAIREYREAIRLKPGLVEARVNLGLALAMKGRLDKAIAEYRVAASMKPGDPIVHFNLANALRAAGRIEESIVEYRFSLRIEPGNAEARYRLGLSLEDAGRLQDAINEYIGTLRLDAGHEAAASSLERALRRSGMRDAAVDACMGFLTGRR
jgi:serine/threonine protein kinase/Tfp pilus assembly protein PilF